MPEHYLPGVCTFSRTKPLGREATNETQGRRVKFTFSPPLSGQPLQPGGMSAAGVNQGREAYIYSLDNIIKTTFRYL